MPTRRLLLSISLFITLLATAQEARWEAIPFGDFEHWATRHLTESRLLGGRQRTIYMLGPTETIYGNKPYDMSKTIWSSSNAYAKLLGITKISCGVRPDVRVTDFALPTGEKFHGTKCARLESLIDSCVVAGIINLKVLSTGCLLWGDIDDPLSAIENPYKVFDWGIPFTGKPKAFILDYKTLLHPSDSICHVFGRKVKKLPGNDHAEIRLMLQNRQEDASGNLIVRRVGTAIYQIHDSSDGWVNQFRVPIIYGDATKDPSYQDFMGLLSADLHYYARNSKGDNVEFGEVGWADPDTPVTHAMLLIQVGCYPAFYGTPGNTMWVDNLYFEY